MQNGENERPHYDAGQRDDDAPGEAASPAANRMSLAELTEVANVSVRTVRYYIAEGLLPPPEGAGPSSAYSAGHLDRLLLIQRLKEAYLPLREIRRRLSGLGDEEVKALLERGSSADSPVVPLEPSLAPARDYLAILETRERYRTEPLALSLPPAADSTARHAPSRPQRGGTIAREHEEAQTAFAKSERRSDRLAAGDPALWRRIPLGDEAELVVSDRVYERHRDRIEWLVRWARKVFG